MPLFLTAIALGFAYAAMPGPVTTESIRRSARQGFRAGFAIQAGSLIGDGVWAAIGLSSVAILLRNATFSLALGIAGSALLLWLTWDVLRAALFPHRVDTSALRNGNALHVGLAFGLANPAGIAFWSGLGVSVFGGDPPSATAVVTLVISFLAGATLWGLFICFVVAWGSARAGERLLRAVDIVSAAFLGFLGIRLLIDTVQNF